jgi:hypothetical protein
MSAAPRARRAGRNLLIALLVGAVIIAAIVVAYVAGRSTTTPSAPPTSASAPSSAVATSSATADAAPTGCLGGQPRNNATVLTAQRLASKSTFGAVEVATAFYRWTYRFPVPSSAEIEGVGSVFVPGQAAESEASLRTGYRQNPNPSTGTVPNGTPFYLSTVTGKWLAEAGTSGGVLVSVEASYVVDGAVSATKTATASFEMKWVDGGWRVAGLAKGEPSKLAAGGTTFTAGC